MLANCRTCLPSISSTGAGRENPTFFHAILRSPDSCPAPPVDVRCAVHHRVLTMLQLVTGLGALSLSAPSSMRPPRRCTSPGQRLGSVLVVSSIFLAGIKATTAAQHQGALQEGRETNYVHEGGRPEAMDRKIPTNPV